MMTTLFPYPGDIVDYVTSFGNVRTVVVEETELVDGEWVFDGRPIPLDKYGQQVWGRLVQITALHPLYPAGYHFCEGRPMQVACQHNDGTCCEECTDRREIVAFSVKHSDADLESFWIEDEGLRNELVRTLVGYSEFDDGPEWERIKVETAGLYVGVERLCNLLARFAS